MCTTLPEGARHGDGHREGAAGVARPRGDAAAAAALLHGRADEPVHLALDAGCAPGDGPPGVPPRAARQRPHARCSRTRSAARRCTASAARRASTSARSTRAPAGTRTTRSTRARSARSSRRSCRASTRADAAVGLDPVRRLLRGLPGQDRHPDGARAPARAGRARGEVAARRPSGWRWTRRARVPLPPRATSARSGSARAGRGPLRHARLLRLEHDARPARGAGAVLPRVVGEERPAGGSARERRHRAGRAQQHGRTTHERARRGPRPHPRGARRRRRRRRRCRATTTARARARPPAIRRSWRASASVRPSTGRRSGASARRTLADEVAAALAEHGARRRRGRRPAAPRVRRRRVRARAPTTRRSRRATSTRSTASSPAAPRRSPRRGRSCSTAAPRSGRRLLTLVPDLHVCVVEPPTSTPASRTRSPRWRRPPRRAGRSRSSRARARRPTSSSARRGRPRAAHLVILVVEPWPRRPSARRLALARGRRPPRRGDRAGPPALGPDGRVLPLRGGCGARQPARRVPGLAGRVTGSWLAAEAMVVGGVVVIPLDNADPSWLGSLTAGSRLLPEPPHALS